MLLFAAQDISFIERKDRVQFLRMQLAPYPLRLIPNLLPTLRTVATSNFGKFFDGRVIGHGLRSLFDVPLLHTLYW